MAKEKKSRVNINNKRASFDYEFLETYTAGIVLVGTEIKSIRAGKASMSDAFCYFDNGQLFVRGINIAMYTWGSWGQHAPMRDRKLLLQKRELRHLQQKVKEKGLTIVGVRLFISDNGYAKLNIALARGKKQYDKRESIKERISAGRWSAASNYRPNASFTLGTASRSSQPKNWRTFSTSFPSRITLTAFVYGLRPTCP